MLCFDSLKINALDPLESTTKEKKKQALIHTTMYALEHQAYIRSIVSLVFTIILYNILQASVQIFKVKALVSINSRQT
jgi:hypothetical protein